MVLHLGHCALICLVMWATWMVMGVGIWLCYVVAVAAKKRSGSKGKDSSPFPAGSKVVKLKPTAAFVAPGQKATGLAKSKVKDRFSSTAKTKVVKATDQLAGGSPLRTSMAINPLDKGQVAGAALTILGTKGSGQISKAVGNRVGQFVSAHTYEAAGRGLFNATGAGGKVKGAMTPFGKTLSSTKIGSAAEQSARIENLIAAAGKTAKIAGSSASRAAASATAKGGRGVQSVAAATAAAAAAKKVKKSKKK